MSRTFSALDILNRAAEYGIIVERRDNNLTLDVPTTLATGKKDRAVAVIKQHEQSILAYLRELGEQPPLCFTCLDDGLETRAEHEYEGLMYCAAHRLGVSDKTFRKLLNDGKVSFRRIGPKLYAIPESEVERLIRERSQLPQVGQVPDAVLLARLDQLEERVSELEAIIHELQRASMTEAAPVSTIAYDEIPPKPTPSEPQKKAISEPSAKKSDLPVGCVHHFDLRKPLAFRHGVSKSSFRAGWVGWYCDPLTLLFNGSILNL